MDEIPGLDLRRLVGCLNRHEVEFILVDGVAGLLRGASRPTSDADLLIDNSDDNVDRFLNVCRELRLRTRVSDPDLDQQLAVRAGQRRWYRSDIQDIFTAGNTDAGPVDVLTSLAVAGERRASYGELVARSTEMAIEGQPPMVLKVAELPLLIESKQATNRPKDQQALGELRQLNQLQAQPSHRDEGVDVDFGL